MQSRLHAVAGRAVVEHEEVPGLLSAEGVTVGEHLLEHVPVADGRLHGADVVAVHRQAQTEVRHHRGHERVPLELAELLEPDREDAHELVAVDDASERVHGQAPVGVSVEGDAEVGLGLDDEALERFEVRRADAVVDVESVGFGGGDDDLGTGLAQSGGADDRGGTVGAVDDDLETRERAHPVGGDRAHELLRVLVRGGRVAGDPSHLGAGGTLPVLVEDREDLVLDGVVELRAAGGEELDAVVGHRVVGGGDDDAERGAGVPDDAGDARRREHSGVEDVDSGRGDSRARRGGEELTGDAGVAADDGERALLAAPRPGEHTGGGDGELERQLRRDVPIGEAAHPVGSEESCHGQVLSHSSVRS